jgi:hypothetical protein
MVSWGRASVRSAERTAGKVDLAKFQWRGRDPRGPRGGAVARQELLATSKPEPPPSRSWFENEKTAKRDDPMFVRRRTESHVPRRDGRRERQNYDRYSQRSPRPTGCSKATSEVRPGTGNNFSRTLYSTPLLHNCPSYHCSTHSPCSIRRCPTTSKLELNLNNGDEVQFPLQSDINQEIIRFVMGSSPMRHGKT